MALPKALPLNAEARLRFLEADLPALGPASPWSRRRIRLGAMPGPMPAQAGMGWP